MQDKCLNVSSHPLKNSTADNTLSIPSLVTVDPEDSHDGSHFKPLASTIALAKFGFESF